jgi:hypothetical protein
MVAATTQTSSLKLRNMAETLAPSFARDGRRHRLTKHLVPNAKTFAARWQLSDAQLVLTLTFGAASAPHSPAHPTNENGQVISKSDKAVAATTDWRRNHNARAIPLQIVVPIWATLPANDVIC